MRVSCFIIVCIGAVLANPRGKRDGCEEVFNAYQGCVRNAHAVHTEALHGGDDGKEDFYSRKSCNYIEEAVVKCAELLEGDCYSAEEVEEMRNQQFEGVVSQLEQAEEWDSDKCPAVKEYKEGLAAAEDGSEDDEDTDEDGDGIDDADTDDDDEESAAGTLVAAPLLSLLVVATRFL